jgi:3-oxoacyl-[acyl-carrier protein] reductase
MNDGQDIVARKVAIVTGGARGIGAAIACRLAEDGHDIAILDLEIESCADTVAAVESRGGRAIAVTANVADEDAVVNGVTQVVERLGPPTILVNNAGIMRDRTLAKMTLDDWETVIDVNLRSVFLMCREVHSHMRDACWGRIINMSSIAALGIFGGTNYSAAKAGIQGITKTIALELGRHGITANVVAPGFILTDMTKEVAERMGTTLDALSEEMLKSIAVGRPGMPDDIANAVSFFVDSRSSFVTGQVLYVAGAPRG